MKRIEQVPTPNFYNPPSFAAKNKIKWDKQRKRKHEFSLRLSRTTAGFFHQDDEKLIQAMKQLDDTIKV